MGRVKKYSKQFSNRNKNKHSERLRATTNDVEMDSKEDRASLPMQKRKQIFKKKDRRDVKKRIKELRLKSLKLKKKDLS